MKEFVLGALVILAIFGAVLAGVWLWMNHAEQKWIDR